MRKQSVKINDNSFEPGMYLYGENALVQYVQNVQNVEEVEEVEEMAETRYTDRTGGLLCSTKNNI